MTNSLLATSYIIEILLADAGVSECITNILPVDARVGTTYPFAIVKRDSVVPSYLTKDIYNTDDVIVSVWVVDPDYKKCLKVANAIRKALERKAFEDETAYISRIELTGANETLMNEAFVQMLTFSVRFEDK